jgi:hypothetical protein
VTTATKIIRGALDLLGIRGAGQNVDGTVATDMLSLLNTLLDAMQLGPTFAYANTETVFSLPANTISRTIGPGQQINIARPSRIETSSFIRVANIDYPLESVDQDTYNEIVMKTLSGTWPVVCFWDGGNPLGNVFFWPQGACSVHLVTSNAVGNFADLTTDYSLPIGYERMFMYALAEEAAPSFEVQPSARVVQIAQASRRMVKRNNLTVPQLKIPRLIGEDGRYVLADFIAGL